MEIAYQIFGLLVIAGAVASIAWTVTQEEIFAEWKEFCEGRVEAATNVFERKFFYVFTCEYCFSHWVTLGMLAITGFQIYFTDWRGYLLAFFTISWVANFMMSFYRRIRVEIKHENALAKKEIAKVDDEAEK
jgi:hypothetical protein